MEEEEENSVSAENFVSKVALFINRIYLVVSNKGSQVIPVMFFALVPVMFVKYMK